MSRFLTELNVQLKPNSDKIWIYISPLIYESDIVGLIEIPAGFETDFASIPRWIPFVSALLLDTAHREPSLHDYLYRKDSIPQASFIEANRVFLEALVVRGKSLIKRNLFYWGVCIGGYFSYHKRNVNDKIEE
ncbi:MAG: DUF1353 domain-containing protein [Smithella sp.]